MLPVLFSGPQCQTLWVRASTKIRNKPVELTMSVTKCAFNCALKSMHPSCSCSLRFADGVVRSAGMAGLRHWRVFTSSL